MPVNTSASEVVNEDFLRAVWPGLVRLGRLLTGSQQQGEDIAQEAIMGLLSHTSVLAPRAYLRRSMVNLSMNLSRKAARERGHLAATGQPEVQAPEMDEIWPLVIGLPARQRAVVVLRYYEDLSEADIAKVLDCRPGTVKSLAARALEHLRKELES